MVSRRELLTAVMAGGMTAASAGLASAAVVTQATPESPQDSPWLSGSSAKHNVPVDIVAESGTVQVVRVSPVLYAEFAVFLIHNATNHAVMLNNVRGVLRVPEMVGFEREQSAYNIPSVILPPNEYWIGSLKLPDAIAEGTDITFDAEVALHTELPASDITTLLTAIPPEENFAIPAKNEPWPVRYRNDASYPPGRVASFQQVFLDSTGRICGVVKSNDTFSDEGSAEFPMRLTNTPAMSTGGVVLGEATASWIAIWSHMPPWDVFEEFDFGG